VRVNFTTFKFGENCPLGDFIQILAPYRAINHPFPTIPLTPELHEELSGMVGSGLLSARHGANIRVTTWYCTCFLAITVRVTVSARTVSVTFVITTPIDRLGTRLYLMLTARALNRLFPAF
jgi:hypothetical protein